MEKKSANDLKAHVLSRFTIIYDCQYISKHEEMTHNNKSKLCGFMGISKTWINLVILAVCSLACIAMC